MLSIYERMIIAACALDRRPPPPDEPQRPNSNGHHGDRPGDVYNARAIWSDVLVPHGWQPIYERSGMTYWKRPGKSEPGISATTGVRPDCGKDLLYVFTTSTVLDSEKSYNKFHAYADLNHGGDHSKAARALREQGYGDPPWGAGQIIGTSRAPKVSADNSDDPLDADATAYDLILNDSTVKWAWEKWLPVGVLSILASEPGVGKTRLCADLARRVHNGLSWPDGSAMTLPRNSVTLWVPADNQHPELGTLPTQFGFPPTALYLNATRRNPFSGTMLDSKEDIDDFEKRIARVRPAIVFIDTCLNATDRSSHKPEDAKAFFVPLQQIAARQQIVLVCVTHLNAAGKPLGRRITGQGRIVIQLEQPDPEGQPDRRRLWVVKSNSLFPAPLGVTMGEGGNDYDTDPPARADDGPQKGHKRKAPPEVVKWLDEYLRTGPKKVHLIRDDSKEKGFSPASLYSAKDELGVHEFSTEGKKWWELT